MNNLYNARVDSLRDIKNYLNNTPINKRVEWLKDGEEWMDKYYKCHTKNTYHR